jgi:hypothetical protein
MPPTRTSTRSFRGLLLSSPDVCTACRRTCGCKLRLL